MKRIQYNKRYRPYIQSGEYKVETMDGYPVRLLDFDAKGSFPIVGVVDMDGEELPYSWDADGVYSDEGRGDKFDLYLVPAEKLTKFEQAIRKVIGYGCDLHTSAENFDDTLDKLATNCAPDVLEAAYRELDKTGYLEGLGWVDHDTMNILTGDAYTRATKEAVRRVENFVTGEVDWIDGSVSLFMEKIREAVGLKDKD